MDDVKSGMQKPNEKMALYDQSYCEWVELQGFSNQLSHQWDPPWIWY